MDYIIDEKGATYDGLICGTKVKLVTENITVTASAAIPRGAIVTANGSMVNTGDVAYGIVAYPVDKEDTVATVYVSGEFNREKLIVGSGDTVEAHKNELRNAGIFLSSMH